MEKVDRPESTKESSDDAGAERQESERTGCSQWQDQQAAIVLRLS